VTPPTPQPRRTRSLVAAAILTLVALPGAGSTVEVGSIGSMREALASAEHASDLTRIARNLDGTVVAQALDRAPDVDRRAAVSLVPHMRDPAPFLPSLIALTSARDRDLASRAARAALEVTRDLDVRSAEGCADGQCALVEYREPIVEALRTSLSTPGISPDVRRDVLGILTTETGRPWFPDVESAVVDLLEDPDPRVRLAAVGVMTPPQDATVLEALLDRAGDDDDARVVGACLLAACPAVVVPEGEKYRKPFEKKLGRLVKKLDPPEDAVAPLRACLVGSATPWSESQAARLPGGGGQ